MSSYIELERISCLELGYAKGWCVPGFFFFFSKQFLLLHKEGDNPRLREPFLATRLPKGGGYHPLPRFLAINLSSPKVGVVPTLLTVFALVLKIAQPRGKIAPGTFKFILSLHFGENIPNQPPTPGVG